MTMIISQNLEYEKKTIWMWFNVGPLTGHEVTTPPFVEISIHGRSWARSGCESFEAQEQLARLACSVRKHEIV